MNYIHYHSCTPHPWLTALSAGNLEWLWHLRWRLTARLARMSVNVMSVDSDIIVWRCGVGLQGCAGSLASAWHTLNGCLLIQGPLPHAEAGALQ